MDASSKAARGFKQGARSRSQFVWIAVLLAAFIVALSFAGTRAGIKPVANHDEARVRLTINTLPHFDCGYEARGAEEAIARHQMHARRSPDRLAVRSARPLTALNQDQGDLALIEDDGSIIVPPSAFDLTKRSVLFTPEANGYRPTPANVRFTNDVGTQVSSFFGIDGQLSTGISGYRDIPIGGAPFTFYGVTYDTLYVGTNGYITFASGDTSARPSVATLAANAPRIAPLWANLDTSGGGEIYYNRLEGRHVITWNAVPESPYGGLSTFQAALYDDGRIAFIYKKVKARTSLVGLSPGNTEQEAQPLVYSDLPDAVISGPMFQLFSKQRQLDLPALMRTFYRTHTDDVDMAFIWADFAYDNGLGVAHSFNVRNDVSGIGLKIFDRGALYGSAARLATVITMGNQNDWPGDPQANTAGLNSAISIVCHELGHRWLAYVRSSGDDENLLLGRDDSHWSFFLDTRTNSDGSFSALMEGNSWREGGGSLFTTSETAVNYFSRLEQYLMGLRPPAEVPPFTYLETDAQLHELLRQKSPISGYTVNAIKHTARVEQIISREGPRLPDAASAPKTFRIAFILLVEPGATASKATLQKMNAYREALARYFSVATDRLASLDTALIQK
ncbi:MAG: hypothetical protein ACJ74G_22005 [Blastocatellia bacterium]